MLYSDNIEPSCVYCQRGTDIGQGEIACIKEGIVTVNDSCPAFRYEPTKRKPHAAAIPKFDELSSDDFSL
jgi:hypothetical protein